MIVRSLHHKYSLERTQIWTVDFNFIEFIFFFLITPVVIFKLSACKFHNFKSYNIAAQYNKTIYCNIHVYDLLIPLQYLKCARIVRNSSKLKSGSVKTFASFFFSRKRKENRSIRFRWRSNLAHYRRLCS